MSSVAGGPDSPTVQSMLAAVGAPVLQALWLPSGPAVPVGEPVLLDVAEGVVAPPGSVLLAIGCRPGAAATASTIEAAAAAGLAAVIIKPYAQSPAPARVAAESAGIALLLADDAVSWPHLYRLLLAVVSGERGTRPEPLSAVVTGDLFALANAVAAMVGGAIAIEDPHQQVLAYSSVPGQPIDDVRRAGILGRRVPAEHAPAELYERIRRSNGVERVELEGLRPRLAVSIRAGDEPIGSIWAIEGDGGFPADASLALIDAARLASLHILRLRITADLERTARAEALRALLLGRVGPTYEVLPAVERHHLTVVAFEILGAAEDSDGTMAARTADLLTVFCETMHRMAACITIGEVIYALLPTGRSADSSILPAMVDRMIARAEESLRVRLRAGIGSTVDESARSPRPARMPIWSCRYSPNGRPRPPWSPSPTCGARRSCCSSARSSPVIPRCRCRRWTRWSPTTPRRTPGIWRPCVRIWTASATYRPLRRGSSCTRTRCGIANAG